MRVFSLATGTVAASNPKAFGSLAKRLARLLGVKFAAVAGVLVVAVLVWVVWGQVSSPSKLNSGGDSSIPGGPYPSLTYTIVAQKDPKLYPDSKPASAADGMIFEVGDRGMVECEHHPGWPCLRSRRGSGATERIAATHRAFSESKQRWLGSGKIESNDSNPGEQKET